MLLDIPHAKVLGMDKKIDNNISMVQDSDRDKHFGAQSGSKKSILKIDGGRKSKRNMNNSSFLSSYSQNKQTANKGQYDKGSIAEKSPISQRKFGDEGDISEHKKQASFLILNELKEEKSMSDSDRQQYNFEEGEMDISVKKINVLPSFTGMENTKKKKTLIF